MDGLRFHRRTAAWLAWLAVVWSALAPTLAQAWVAHQAPPAWVEVCTATGMLWVQADTGVTTDTAPSEPSPSKHCPWCTPHRDAACGPSAQTSLALPARLTDLPPAFYRSAHAATVWLPAQSRAPPCAA